MSAYRVSDTTLNAFHELFEDELVGGRAGDSNHTYIYLTLKPKLMKREYRENTK